MEFIPILGNQKNIEHFEAALRTGKLSHAYLISGASGSGKKTFVRSMAAALLCERKSITPCGKCASCVKILSGNHPDFIWLKQQKPTVIRVDEVREQLVETIQVFPHYGSYKIYVIDQAELMNASGQNAILKTLEEPPEYGLIFLLTEKPEALLETIRSRCVGIEMENLPDSVIRKALKDKGFDDNIINEASAYARGNLGKAEDIASGGEQKILKDKIAAVLADVRSMDAFEINQTAKELKEFEKNEALEAVLIWFRDVLVAKSNENIKNIYYIKEGQLIASQAQALSYESLNSIFDAIDMAKLEAQTNVQPEPIFEVLLMKIRAEFSQ